VVRVEDLEDDVVIKTILVPVDFEENSLVAVDYAFGLAEKLGARVHLLHAYPPVLIPDGYGSGTLPFEEQRRRALAELQRVAAAHHASASSGRCVVEMGDPLTVILETTTRLEADLVVLGTHDRKGFKRLMLGSVAESVMREVEVPVVIAKGARADGRGAREDGDKNTERDVVEPSGAWSHRVSLVPG
jgi:nucleotide-binding universal stress UspA family protein